MRKIADKTKYVLSIALMVSIFVPCGIIVALGELGGKVCDCVGNTIRR